MSESKDLWPYQSRLIRHLQGAFKSGARKVALISPTGSGKSLMVSTLLARLQAAGVFNGAVVAVPQTHIKRSFGFAGNVIDKGDEHGPRKRPHVTDTSETCVTDLDTRTTAHLAEHLFTEVGPFAYVCTHATLASKPARKLVEDTDLSAWLLVIDEGHRSTSDKDANRLSQLRDAWLAGGGSVLLVTATPYRTDGTPVLDDDWFRVSRSIADQCADGFAPEHLECRHRPVNVKAKSRAEFEDGGKASAAFVKAIVQDWSEVDRNAKGDRPKAIVIVPQTDSQRWTKMLVREFTKRGARVFDATGVSNGKKAEVQAVLEREGAVTRWQDSTIDVMIGCKRFDEGTDWPLCSHVYVIGYPVSIGTTVQRWGRATRSKAGIRGHRFPGVASITFYVHAWSKELGKDLAKGGRLSLHRETSHLIAAHLHDWETSQQYAKAYKGIWDAARRGPRKHREKAEQIEQAVAMTEAEAAMAVRDIDEARAKLGLGPSAPLGGEDLRRVVETVAKRRGDDRASAVAQVLVERSSCSTGKLDKAVAGHVRDAKIAGQAQSLVRKEMRAKFRAIVASLDLEYHDTAAEQRLADVARWNGEQVKELAERMRSEGARLLGSEYESVIENGARLFIDDRGKRPSKASGDATKYVGFEISWAGIHSALAGGYNGLSGYVGLRDFLDKKGIGTPLTARLDGAKYEEAVLSGIRIFMSETGRRPSRLSGDATKYVGFHTTWNAIDGALRTGLHGADPVGGLPQFMRKHSVPDNKLKREPKTEQDVRPVGLEFENLIARGATIFLSKTGSRPTRNSGDASEYVGIRTTWAAIDAAFVRGYRGVTKTGGLPAFLDGRGIGKPIRRRNNRPRKMEKHDE